jgi:hypothetical protein
MLAGVSLKAQSPDQLPPQWQSLPAGEFATLMGGFYSPHRDTFLADIDENSIRQHAAELYVQIDLASTSLSLEQIDVLQGLAYPELDQPRMQRDLDLLSARQEDWAGKQYAELRAKMSMFERLGASGLAGPIGQQWLAAGGSIDEIWPYDLLAARELLSDWIEIPGSCSVTWTGSVQVPSSGTYTFSVPDLRISAQVFNIHEDYELDHSVSLKIDGVEILSSSSEAFEHKSQPVQLDAGNDIPIEMVSIFQSSRMPKRVAQGILYWTGPGLNTVVVAPENFSDLRQTFRWQDAGVDREVIQSVPNIDNAWPDRVSLGMDSESTAHANEMIWSRLMLPEFLALHEQRGRCHPFLAHSEDAVELLSVGRSREFLGEVISRPNMIQWLYPKEAVDVYRSFRLKDPELALEAFGLWATLNSDLDCQLPMQYISRMRHFREFFGFDYYYQRAWRTMAQCVSVHSPSHAERLEEEFLELEDGSCCLPVAQILTYVYMGQDRHSEWVARLAERTGDESLTGDQRVNWYLASAQAHELRLGPHCDVFAIVNPRPMDALGILDSALLVADDRENRMRVLRAKAARYASLGDFASARGAIDEARGLASPERAWEVDDWQHTLDRFEAHQNQLDERQSEDTAEAYLTTLRRRMDAAASRGDTDAAQRYGDLIRSLGGE